MARDGWPWSPLIVPTSQLGCHHQAPRRRRGEDGISFEHRGPCSDPSRHRHCPGLWRGELTLGYTGDGKRTAAESQRQDQGRRGGQAPRPAYQLDKGVTPKAGYAHYTVRQAAADWLAHGLDGRSPKTITKNQNVLAPILAVIGARKLRDLTADDVRQALAAMAGGYSTAAVRMGTWRSSAPSGTPKQTTSLPATSPPWPTPPKASKAAHPGP